MLSYTYCNALLAEQLNVRTALSDTFYEGGIIGLYLRPMGMLGQVAAQTVGGWLPRLCLFSLPMALLAVPLGIDLRPQTLWALPSLACAISLGFAVDYLFAGMTIRVPNAIWLVHVIRMALTGLFSGALIPFALLPWGLGDVLTALPLGSLAGAPLSLYAGLARPQDVLPTQLLWNLLLWPLALWLLAKSRERMVAFGG